MATGCIGNLANERHVGCGIEEVQQVLFGELDRSSELQQIEVSTDQRNERERSYALCTEAGQPSDDHFPHTARQCQVL